MIEIRVTGMSCQHCVAAVKRALESVPGVTGVRVELESGLARVQGEAEAAPLERAVIDAGYGVGGSTGDAP